MNPQGPHGFHWPFENTGGAMLEEVFHHHVSQPAFEGSFHDPYSDDYDDFTDQRFVLPIIGGVAFAVTAVAKADTVFVSPIPPFQRDISFDRLMVNVVAGSTVVGDRVIVGVYEADYDVDRFYPGQLVTCSPSTQCSATGVLTFYQCFTLKANTLYWTAFAASSTSTFQIAANANLWGIAGIDNAMGTVVGGTDGKVSYTWDGSLPCQFPTGGTFNSIAAGDNQPLVGLGVCA